MKILRYSILTLIVVFFVGCYEVTEEIVVKDDGSGTYSTRMDMSALLEMMQTMAGEAELTKGGLDRPLDTTILLKNVLDSAQDIQPDQKLLLKDGVMKLQMDISQKIFKADMNFPFNDYSQLKSFMAGAGSAGLSKSFKSVYGGGDSAKTDSPSPQDQALEQYNNIFDITTANGIISKKLNKERYQTLLNNPDLASAKEMAKSGMEILYTTIINLPRPVKKSDNPLIKLSADKKTVTIKYNLLSLFETPEKFSYTIVY